MSKHRDEKAIALKYRPEEDVAPIIIASGYGNNAKKIIEIAENHGIPVFRDESTASFLSMLEVGKVIPPEVYEVVALIYSNILNLSEKILQKKLGKENSGNDCDS